MLEHYPYHDLSWQDFERLCLRLAQRDAAVEGCRLYGEQGDAQAGIDLYARELYGEKYVVYQCKRVREFGPANIKVILLGFCGGGVQSDRQWRLI
ncbi:restriction endonuclease [Deinococcus aquatilis]|uniref:restriction endonuclease n=1 Tax=Deinococcus aquatilis TaxID=519440 RepID=UPI00036086FF